jgi:hypothetical protein
LSHEIENRIGLVVRRHAHRFGIGASSGAGRQADGREVSGRGYTVQRSEIGNPFLQFILQKSTATGQVLVWCSVQVQTGETSSCRTIK